MYNSLRTVSAEDLRWGGKTAVAIDLTEGERRELESLASRRRTAQGLAQQARIALLAAEGVENKDISLRVRAAPNTVGKWRRRFASIGWKVSTTSPVPARRARSATTRSPRSFARPLRRRRGTQRTGACVRWPKPPGLRLRQFIGSGRPSIFSPIAPKRQAFHRPPLCRKGARYRRSIPVAARTRSCSVRRREEPDPGAGSISAAAPDAPGTDRAADA